MGGDVNVRAKAIKFLERNIDINLCEPGLGKCFLNVTLDMQATKDTVFHKK